MLRIKQGWHPLLQQRVSQLVPNDCSLGAGQTRRVDREGRVQESTSARLMLLTGPNASGKTVYLRTMALITYLAHVGYFVPAEAALVGLTDGIYTRMHSKESSAINASAFMLDLNQVGVPSQ